MNEVEQLKSMLKKVQEPKGFFFNQDRERVFDLLAALLENKKRYGYMVCPCRLASGERKLDEDIICPCRYRGEDVKEYGSCYCNLYVSQDWNQGRTAQVYVPERRPLSKLPY